MGETVPVLIVHGDEAVQQWARAALPESEFSLVIASSLEGLGAALVERRPRAILMDAALGLADKRLRETALGLDPPAVLVALISPGGEVSAARALECGADDALVLPLAGELLCAQLRATLRLLRRTLTAHEVCGEIGAHGPLVLIKHCEDHRLTGRLTVTSGRRSYWAEFFGGELMGTGSDAGEAGGDELAALMALHTGSYVFVQRAVEPLGPTLVSVAEQPVAVPQAEASEVVAPPEPIVATVGSALQRPSYEVRTTGENRPEFTITTVVLRGEQRLRETQTAWPHPIGSEADLAQARVQMQEQHERVTAKLREMVENRSANAPVAAAGGVDGTLLSWAVHFVVEQAWADLGTTVTANLLGRTQSALRRKWPHLAHFRIGEKAHVAFDLSHGPMLASDAVEAIASWLASFLWLARRVVPELTRLDVRQATALMSTALEQVGFYSAYSAAIARCERDGVQLGAEVGEHGPEA